MPAEHNGLLEVSLLYRHTPKLKDQVEAICETVEDHGAVVLEIIEINETSLAVICDDVRIVLTDTAGPMAADAFLAAARPARRRQGEADVLPPLDTTVHAVRIVVMDPERAPPCGAATFDVKRAIAWDLAACLSDESEADMIHWAETDILYTGEEFLRATDDMFPCRATPHRASRAPMRAGAMRAAPDMTEPCEVWLDANVSARRPVVLGDGPLPEARPPSRLDAAFEAARSMAGPARSLFPLGRIRAALNQRRTLH